MNKSVLNTPQEGESHTKVKTKKILSKRCGKFLANSSSFRSTEYAPKQCSCYEFVHPHLYVLGCGEIASVTKEFAAPSNRVVQSRELCEKGYILTKGLKGAATPRLRLRDRQSFRKPLSRTSQDRTADLPFSASVAPA